MGVSIGIPGWYKGARELRLAPTRQMLHMSSDEYDVLYNKMLLKLDPKAMYEELVENAVLLCWERPYIGVHGMAVHLAGHPRRADRRELVDDQVARFGDG